MNPFAHRSRSIQGPATDAVPVTPDDATDLPMVAIGLYVEAGGTVVLDTIAGESRSIAVADFSILPIGVRRVRLSGTTATGIHALVLA
jgi:enoyl-CoA hydratase/carnithine racemase